MAKKQTVTKALVDGSINVRGIGTSDIKTIFNITDESERNDRRFRNLTMISGRTLSIEFDYTEGEVKKSDRLSLKIITSDQEQVIKDFILSEINTYLSK